MNNEFIAHVLRNDNGSWASPQLLSVHLENTAKLAEAFTNKFNSGEWGKAAGLAHDAGKGRLVWQKYIQHKSGYGYDEEAHLEGKPGKIPHAIHGAKLAEVLFGKVIGRILAYCIAGHHAGLPDWSSAEGAGQSSLQFQETQLKDLNDVAGWISDQIQLLKPESPPWQFAEGIGSAFVDQNVVFESGGCRLFRYGILYGQCKIEQQGRLLFHAGTFGTI